MNIPLSLNAQEKYLLEKKLGQELSVSALNAVYNWEFDKAQSEIERLSDAFPDHPAVPMLEALIVYWQEFPFQSQNSKFQLHQKKLKATIRKAESILSDSPNNLEASFLLMMARSTMMRNFASFGKNMKALGEAKKVYSLMIDGFDWKEAYPEFYFSTGLYNYYREYYPEAHPFYKPLTIFFKSGDKAKGLEQLEYASEHTVFSKPEAMSYLALIYFRSANQPEKSIEYFKDLYRDFKGNHYYLVNYIEALLLTDNPETARNLNELLSHSPNDSFFKAAYFTFEGMVAEKEDKKWQVAANHYHRAREILEENDIENYAESLRTYVYTGLSNYYKSLGDKKAAGAYRDMAKKYDEYNYLKRNRK